MDLISTFRMLTLPFGFLVTILLTFVFLKVGQKKGILDIPNDRSSHSSPVPRGGGVAIIILFFVFLIVLRRNDDNQIADAILQSLLFGGMIVAVVGIIDDVYDIPARWRFLAHCSAAFLSLSMLPNFPSIEIFRFSLDFGCSATCFSLFRSFGL